MLIGVPQYTDVEDKIVGPITAKQLGWLVLMGVTTLIMWKSLPFVGFMIIGIPWGIFCLALAFYKPYGQPLGSFLIFGVMYMFKPKVYIWKRTAEKNPYVAPPKVKEETVHVEKKLSSAQIQGLAKLLDSNGMQTDKNIVELLKEKQTKK
jgi:hypothetical protein